ncbi:ABC transporter ATP-binding protein [Oceanisphaera arctica]|uniref:ABC transporter ATP-binding protein n=1 Tax=Oceanisphaera arctica TaxID=641510 RepID=A0A2P5TJZ2_9GAMM|nr:ABC transporter ATP-binding protein [Oceanisphaera arctica]PPL15342.1 ABC transporter ATP-binding protein [Oceanisphaera arctica]GHA29310.1 transporter [Oceanisphaera arctica]
MDKKTLNASLLQWPNIIRMMQRHRSLLIYAHLFALCGTLLAVPVPLLMPLLVDEVLLDSPGHLLSGLDWLLPAAWQTGVGYILAVLVITLLLRSLSLVFNIIQGRQFARVAKHLTFQIRRRLARQLTRTPLRAFESIGAGSVSSHFVTDVETLDKFLGETLSRLLISIFSVVGTAVVLLLLNWQLGLFILLLNPVVVYFSSRLGSRVKHLKRNENSAFEVFQQALVETLDGIHEIRAANRERHYMLRVIDRARGVRDTAIDYAWKSEAAGRASFLLFLSGVELFRATGMIMVLYTDLTVGQIFAVFSYLWFMMGPVQDLLNMQYSFYAATAALKRINRMLALGGEPEHPGRVNPFEGATTLPISVTGLSFSYNGERKVLDDVSLQIRAGEKVALVGASGGGKSTFIQLLLGLYPADAGDIRFGDVSSKDIGFPTIREHVATVLQQPILFNDTVRSNLSLGDMHDDEALWQALRVAQLDEVIAAMEQGLDTQVGRRGVKLSGGQQQRLAIARMVLKNPAIVILDEATSALDTETEQKLHQALADFLRGRTTLIVAHRLSSVRQADRVLVFEDGKISQSGTHHELLEQPGLYRTLYY